MSVQQPQWGHGKEKGWNKRKNNERRNLIYKKLYVIVQPDHHNKEYTENTQKAERIIVMDLYGETLLDAGFTADSYLYIRRLLSKNVEFITYDGDLLRHMIWKFWNWDNINILDLQAVFTMVYGKHKGWTDKNGNPLSIWQPLSTALEYYDEQDNGVDLADPLDVITKTNGVWCISPVKTLKSKRVVDMPKKLSKFLFDRKKAMIRAKQEQGFRSRSNEIVMDIRDTTPSEIVGGDFVNRKLEDGLAGKLLTTNSLKFYGNKITKEYGFALKMHKLRKTNLTYLAENGASFKYLKEHAGHLKVETTLKYYIKAGETSKEQGMRILDSMTTEDPLITIEGPGIGGQETRVFTVRKSQWERIQSEQRRKK